MYTLELCTVQLRMDIDRKFTMKCSSVLSVAKTHLQFFIANFPSFVIEIIKIRFTIYYIIMIQYVELLPSTTMPSYN